MTQVEVQRAVDRLGEELGRSVVINDPAVRMMYASQHFGDEDDVRIRAVLHRDAGSVAIGHVLAQGVSGWSKPGPIPGNASIGMSARFCFPVRWRGDLLGLLMVIDAHGTLTTGDIQKVEAVVREVAALMAGARDSADLQLAADEATVANLLSRQPTIRSSAIADLEERHRRPVEPLSRAITLTVDEVGGGADPEHVGIALRHALSAVRISMQSTSLRAIGDGTGTVVIFSSAEIGDDAMAAQAHTMLRQVHEIAAGRFTCVAGVGETAEGVEGAWLTARQARISCQGAARAGTGGVAHWSDLGVLAVLLRIAPSELDETAVPREIVQLARTDRGSRLVETLHTYLDHGCSGPEAARALHIHRTTLYYRLDRIRELTGLDLDDGRTRLALHLGLKVLPLVQADFRH